MASCQICAKSKQVGNSVSHSQRKNKRKVKPNIQKVTFLSGNQLQKMQACARCLKNII